MSSQQKRRILYVIGNLGLGGAQSVLYHNWPSLTASTEYEFELCTLTNLGHFGERLYAEGAIIHELRNRADKYDITLIPRLRKLISSRRYSIIHTQLFPELYQVALATLGINVPLIYTEQAAHNRRRNHPITLRYADKLAYRRYSHIIAVNSSTRDNLVHWLPELARKITIIPNSVRTEYAFVQRNEFRKSLVKDVADIDLTSKLVLFAGRLTYQKGVDILLTAFDIVVRKNIDVFLLIAGDGEDRAQLQELATSLGISNRTIFLGTRSDVPELLHAADMMVLPSRWEGLSLVMLEAMAVGCPIVVTAVDGAVEALTDGVTALLVEPENPEILSGAIVRLLEDACLCQSLAAQAKSIVKDNYSATTVVQQILRIYDGLLPVGGD